jgi:hypothetical protein
MSLVGVFLSTRTLPVQTPAVSRAQDISLATGRRGVYKGMQTALKKQFVDLRLSSGPTEPTNVTLKQQTFAQVT